MSPIGAEGFVAAVMHQDDVPASNLANSVLLHAKSGGACPIEARHRPLNGNVAEFASDTERRRTTPTEGRAKKLGAGCFAKPPGEYIFLVASLGPQKLKAEIKLAVRLRSS